MLDGWIIKMKQINAHKKENFKISSALCKLEFPILCRYDYSGYGQSTGKVRLVLVD